MPVMAPGMEDMAQGLQDMLTSSGTTRSSTCSAAAQKKRKRKVKVKEALELLTQEEAARMVDMERVVREALDRAQNAGIIFIDEIDKIAGRDGRSGPRRLARRRAARPPPDRGGLEREHEVRRW